MSTWHLRHLAEEYRDKGKARLCEIRRRRAFNPAAEGAPGSTELLREGRGR